MSTRLLTDEGSRYPTTDVFIGGVLDEKALFATGIPRLTGSFAYSMFMANAAVSRSNTVFEEVILTLLQIGALITHCIVFWGGDVVRTVKDARKGIFGDRRKLLTTPKLDILNTNGS